MAYYDALIAKWATLTPGTVDNRLAQINALTAPAPAIPAILQTYQIYNAIVPSEFIALTTTNQQLIRDILGMGIVDASPGTNIRSVIQGVFTGKTTLTSLAALVAPYDSPTQPWWKSSGYPERINGQDIVNAGLN